MINLFVYGTLKQGHSNHDRYLLGKYLEVKPGVINDYEIQYLNTLPYAIYKKGSSIEGEIFTISDSTLSNIDRLEEYYPGREYNMYNRISCTTTDGCEVHMYIGSEDYFNKQYPRSYLQNSQ